MDVNKDEILSTPKKNLSITYIRISACVILLLFLFFVKSFKPIFYNEIKNWYECNFTVSNYDVEYIYNRSREMIPKIYQKLKNITEELKKSPEVRSPSSQQFL